MSEEAETKRKFLVVIDETPECWQALIFAAKRAERTGASVLALAVMPNTEFQHWLGIEERMREEALEEGNEMLDKALARLAEHDAETPERKIVFGHRADGIRAAIAEDPGISVLVLAAANGPDGPGPLVSAIAGGQSGSFPVPITIVPGSLTIEEIEAIV
ncbi:MAG: universal stress protein [Pseudomonadota bacterium]